MKITDLNFIVWYDPQSKTWEAKAEEHNHRGFVFDSGDDPVEALQNCVVRASIVLASKVKP